VQFRAYFKHFITLCQVETVMLIDIDIDCHLI